jgi:hypothetical protein
MSVVAQRTYQKNFGQCRGTNSYRDRRSEKAEAAIKSIQQEFLQTSIVADLASCHWFVPTAAGFSITLQAQASRESWETPAIKVAKGTGSTMAILRDASVAQARKEKRVAVSDVKRLFSELSRDWREATNLASSASEIVLNQSYQRIIGLGPDVIPLVLADLRARGGHWFSALRALTGENPVRPLDVGRIKKMTESWLNWGRQKGLI